MGKYRDPFWGGYKEIIRRYGGADGTEPKNLRDPEKTAVSNAIQSIKNLPDGTERIKVLDLVFWKRTHSLPGAAISAHVSERTARRWHTEFIKTVARNLWEETQEDQKTG